MNHTEYEQAFGLTSTKVPDKAKALTIALEIRKFEIELYWKRATYFWAFIAVALAGYVTVLTSKDISSSDKAEALLTASCVGLVFSVAWYFVNRASKFWQENWEKHVDLLEDGVVGPVYKTVLAVDDLSFWRLWGPYPFSVSKLNQTLSLFIVTLFVLLTGVTTWKYFVIGWPPDVYATAILFLTPAAIVVLYWKGRTAPLERTSQIRAYSREGSIVHGRNGLNVVCLGWGSLIWDSGKLPLSDVWHADGPLIPVEFSRKSSDGRITLVIDPAAARVPVLWARLTCDDLKDAKEALREREQLSGDNWANNIGVWRRGEPAPEAIADLPKWAACREVDAVIWTALKQRFDKRSERPTISELIDYLRTLTGEVQARARQYIELAPKQIDTEYRRKIEADLGWYCRQRE